MKRCLTLMMATFAMVFHACAGDWIYDGSTSPATIRDAESDWNWKLKVAGPLTDGAITITDWVSGSGSTSGVLDLRDFTVGGQTVTALSLGTGAFYELSTLTEFYATNVVSDLVATFAKATALTNAVIAGTGVTKLGVGNVSNSNWGTFEGCTGLVSVKLDTPNLSRIEQYAFKDCTSLSCPTADYIPADTVTHIGEKAFYKAKVAGDIVLNNLNEMGTRAFLSSSITGLYINGGEITSLPGESDGVFEQCNSMTNFVIKAPNFQSFGKYAVWKCAKLKTLYVSSTNAVTADSYTFEQCYFISVTFDGPAPAQSVLDTILRSVTAQTGAKNCTLYCSKRQTGWTDFAAELTDTETAATPPADCFGVFRADSRKAWMVDITSPYDPASADSVYVNCSPTGIGDPSPSIGLYEEVEDGTVFTAAEYVFSGDNLYRCASHQIDEWKNGGWVMVETTAGRSWTYHTTNVAQRLTWVHELCGGKLSITGDPTPSVTITPDPFYDGAYTNGTQMTLTANDLDQSTKFSRWTGAVPPGCSSTSPTLQFAFDGSRSLGVEYRNLAWTGYTEDEVYKVTDSNWIFEASFDETTGLLTLNACTAGSGVLDMRDILVNGVQVTGLVLAGEWQLFNGHRTITRVYMNNLAADLTSTFCSQVNLTTAELGGAGVTEFKMSNKLGVFDGCTGLVDLRCNFPNLRKLGDFAFYDCSALTNDIATLVPRSVTNIGHRVFINASKLRGCLVLDRCDYIGHGSFKGCGIDEIRLGDGDLTRFCNYIETSDGGSGKSCGVFQSMPNLTNLVVDAKDLTYVGTNAFLSCAKLKTVTFASQSAIAIAPSDSAPALTGVKFEGPAPTTDSLDNLLAGVTATDGKKTCVIKVPGKGSFAEGWQSLAAPLNDGEEKDNAPKRCLGVYRADSRKAYLVGKGSAGLAILCR